MEVLGAKDLPCVQAAAFSRPDQLAHPPPAWRGGEWWWCQSLADDLQCAAGKRWRLRSSLGDTER